MGGNQGDSTRTSDFALPFVTVISIPKNFSQCSRAWEDGIAIDLMSLCLVFSSVKWA